MARTKQSIADNRNSNESRGNPSGKRADIYGFSVVEIARATRVSSTQICRVFSGRRGVSLRLAAKIARYVGVPLEQLDRDLAHVASLARRRRVPFTGIRGRSIDVQAKHY